MTTPRPRQFRERNQAVVGAVAVAILVALVAAALNFAKLPLVSSARTYRADMAQAGDLASGDQVTVAGVRVGQVSRLRLDGTKVLVTFTVARRVHLGSLTRADAKVLTPIGQEYLALTPAGPGTLSPSTPIPLSRTSIPSTLVGDLNTFGGQVSQYNLSQLARALQAAGGALGAVPSEATAKALSGLARFSSILAGKEGELRTLIDQGAGLTAVLNQRSGQLVDLVTQGDLVLQVLKQRRALIDKLLVTTSDLSKQLDTVLVGERAEITGLLANLQSVSAVLASDSTSLADAIPVLAAFDRYAANASGSGPYVDTVIPTTLIPDNVVKQCAAQQPTNPTLGCNA